MVPINGSGLARVALLNDFSCFGKCSLTVSIPIISAYGIETVPLPTAVLSTHTGGFDRFVMRDMSQDMKDIAQHWKEMDMKFDCIYTGFFCTTEQIEFARKFIQDFSEENTIIIVDPVLGDNGSLYSCFTEEFASEMRKLCDMADIITPNLTEAQLLVKAGMAKIKTKGSVDATGKHPDGTDAGNSSSEQCFDELKDEDLLSALPNENVIITSVRRGDRIGYLARLGDEVIRIEEPMIHQKLHGTGDVFTSALCGEVVSGTDIKTALANAAEFCDRCIHDTAKYQPAHWYGLAFEEELSTRTM
jgi:pyridoxine kinase